MMPWVGLGLLLLIGAGIVGTGLPAAVILITAATLGAGIGVASGAVPLALLSSLPSRLINLLENDLLQALPLYVLMGALINRLPVADALYRVGVAMLPRKPSAPLVSGVALGALLGPMNGSVAASVLALSRVVAPRLADFGVPPATCGAVVAVASTLGIVVPPSLVLILLGDAMMSAHTIAVTATGRTDRVLNTQDVFHGALVPAGIYLFSVLAIAWWSGRRAPKTAVGTADRDEGARPGQIALAILAVTAILVLLGGVATGYFYAVEAAAMGAFALLLAGFATGQLRWTILTETLREVMSFTGALFFLLVAASTLTLVLRLLGTDRLVKDWVAAIPGGDVAATTVVLAIIGASALALDAFEIIFVIVPIVIPPLLIRVADARWVAVLVLLTLQTSFLLPPVGYALMMVRSTMRQAMAFRALVRALAPFLIAQWALLAVVITAPQFAHVGEDKASRNRGPAVPLSEEEINRRIEQMLPPPSELPSITPDLR
jgi:tripartite ATP-independent transporter DctM subunit